jgi:hypothetical protein
MKAQMCLLFAAFFLAWSITELDMLAPRFQSKLLNQLSWFKVLQLLGCDITTTFLPATIQCPLCMQDGCKVLTIAPGKGEWAYCTACQTSGDMVSLAARCWQTDRRTAAARLADSFALGEISKDDLDRDTQWYEFQESIRCLWQKCRQPGPSNSLDLRWAARLLGIKSCSVDAWYARAGKFAGVLSKEQIREHFPGFAALGRLWDEAAVVPLYSLPGKISSFLTILRSASEGVSELYQVPDPSGLKIGGFLGLEAVTGSDHPEFGNKVLLLSDPLLALKLHERHLTREDQLLPVAGFCGGDASNLNASNGLFGGKKVYIWGPVIDRDLLLWAKKVDGWIVTDEDRKDSYWNDMMRVGLPAWVGRKLRLARPWDQALATYLKPLGCMDYESVFWYMQLSEHERLRLLAWCRPEEQQRLFDIERNSKPTTVSVGPRSQVFEQSGHWYLQNDRTRSSPSILLSAAVLRVDRIVRFAGRSKKLYEGRILYRGHVVPFSVTASARGKFRVHTANWMRDMLIDAGLGILHYFPCKSPRLLDVALYLHEPAIVTARDRCGWDAEENAFIFDGFSIAAHGKVETGMSVHAPLIPGRNLHPPLGFPFFTREQICLMSEPNPVSSLVWSVTACVLANLLAPLCNQTTTGIALVGEGASLIGPWIAKGLGCVECKYSPGAEARHGWPIVLTTVRGHHLARQLSLTGPHNCVAVLSDYAAAVLGIEGGWNCVTCEYPCTSLEGHDEVLPLVVPAYLAWLAGQKFRLPESNSYAESVLLSLVDWIKSVGGQADHLKNSSMFLSPDQPEGCRHRVVVQHFVDLLCRMLAEGYVRISLNIALGMVVDGDKVFLPKQEINRALAKRKLPPIATELVTRALEEEQILLGEEYIDGLSVWSLDPGWWKRTYETWIKTKNRTYRVVN